MNNYEYIKQATIEELAIVFANPDFSLLTFVGQKDINGWKQWLEQEVLNDLENN